jgi:hypothetical protein
MDYMSKKTEITAILVNLFSLLALIILVSSSIGLRARYYALLALTILLLLAMFVNQSLVFSRNYLKGILRNAAIALLVISTILVIRYITLGNTTVWRVYKKLLEYPQVTLRQNRILCSKAKTDFKKCKYLAMGSSQINPLCINDTARKKGLVLLAVAGLQPWEYIFYQNEIKKHRPDVIIFFVSELDIAKRLDTETLGERVLTNPNQWGFLIKLFTRLKQDGHLNIKSSHGFYANFLGNPLPEYKYGFIFRSLLDKLMGFEAHKSPSVALDIKLNTLEYALGKDSIEINMEFFEDFTLFCDKENISIIIAEGQYMPLAYTKKALELNQIVTNKIRKMAEKYDHVKFIPRSKLYNFQTKDYLDNDITHVKKEVGERYIKSIFSYLED